MSTIITRNSANSGSTPSSLVQGELAINVTDGRLFYGSGSGNVVKEFTGSASGGSTSPGGPNQSVQFNRNGVFSGSNNFTFNSASNALTLTGSLNITGSTLQIGNNTLLGNTTLSGSIIISGSLGTPTPTVRIYGDTTHDGYVRFDPVSTNIDTSISASYIYVSGSTNDLYFSQNGNGYTNTTRLRWLEGNLYTGLLNGGIVTQVNSNTYQISSGSGIVVDLNSSYNDNPYPVVEYLNWGNITNTIDALSGSFDQQFIAISSSAGTAVIKAQGIPYVDGDYNDFIPIGIVLHQNRSSINGVQTFPGVAYGWKQRSFDFIKAFGALKISGYNLTPSGSSTRGLLLSGGTSWVDGRNYIVDPNQPSYIVEATGTTTSKIFRYYQSGSNWQSNWGYNTNGGTGFTDIDPTQYSNAGTLTSVGSNKWTIQRVYYFPNSATKALFVYYGNAEYANEAEALAAVTTETFTEAPNTAASSIYVGYMILRNDANFTVPASYEFYQAGLFRGSGTGGAGGGGASTLAGLTDVSLSSLSNGDLFSYNGITGLWNNTKILSGSYTLSGSLTTNDGVNVVNLTASFISASSITGSLLAPQSLDSQNRYLIDSLNTTVVDWANQQLFQGSSGKLSANWSSYELYDNAVSQSIDWTNRHLYNTDGTTISTNWATSVLNDSGGNTSIEWSSRVLSAPGYTTFTWDVIDQNYSLGAFFPVSTYFSQIETFAAITSSGAGGAIQQNLAGEIIPAVGIIDAGVSIGNLVYLNTDGIWYKTNQTSLSSSYMLGICTDSTNSKERVFIEGTIGFVTSSIANMPYVSGSNFYGTPIYISGSNGAMSTQKPTSGIVRVVGHAFYNSTGTPANWLMKFRPSNDWYEI